MNTGTMYKKKVKKESDILKWMRETREKEVEGIQKNEKEFKRLKEKHGIKKQGD